MLLVEQREYFGAIFPTELDVDGLPSWDYGRCARAVLAWALLRISLAAPSSGSWQA